MIKSNVTKEICSFSVFLESSWSQMMKIFKDGGLNGCELQNNIGSFMQANWEILVEQIICSENENLESYYGGADIYDEFDRVSFPENEPNVKIILKSKGVIIELISNKSIEFDDLEFCRFVSFDGFFYSDEPPFSHVLVEELPNFENNLIFRIEDLEFYKEMM